MRTRTLLYSRGTKRGLLYPHKQSKTNQKWIFYRKLRVPTSVISSQPITQQYLNLVQLYYSLVLATTNSRLRIHISSPSATCDYFLYFCTLHTDSVCSVYINSVPLYASLYFKSQSVTVLFKIVTIFRLFRLFTLFTLVTACICCMRSVRGHLEAVFQQF